jgi:hypothetical protein
VLLEGSNKKSDMGAHENMRAWEADEDFAMISAINSEGGHRWKNIGKKLRGRSVSSIRNRYQRLQKGHLSTNQTNILGKNICQKCGQTKKGHICTLHLYNPISETDMVVKKDKYQCTTHVMKTRQISNKSLNIHQTDPLPIQMLPQPIPRIMPQHSKFSNYDILNNLPRTNCPLENVVQTMRNNSNATETNMLLNEFSKYLHLHKKMPKLQKTLLYSSDDCLSDEEDDSFSTGFNTNCFFSDDPELYT